MKETVIVKKKKVEPKNPILIEGLPGRGLVGKIAIEYLVKQLRAKKIADLYSPHFPHYVMVDNKGSVRLLRSEFYHWKNEQGENDLILLTGDSQAQTIEGQYEVADVVLDFANKKHANLIMTIGGYPKEGKVEPQVLASATNQRILKIALEAGVGGIPSGTPIVGTAGLLLGLARLKDLDAICFLVETPGYIPDPKAAKNVLNALMRMLKFKVDLSGLDKDIHKSKQIEEKMKRIKDQRRISEKRRQKIEEEKASYIS
jgi:uncharacterized protein (TIGR00162 family)